MENTENASPMQATRKPKGIKSVDVRRLRREGFSNTAISELLNVTPSSVSYHLRKRSTVKASAASSRKESIMPVTSFEADLFGTVIKLDRIPASIEHIGNKIIIK